MVVMEMQLKTVNAIAAIDTEYAEPFTEEKKKEIEDACAEIAFPHKIKQLMKKKENTA